MLCSKCLDFSISTKTHIHAAPMLCDQVGLLPVQRQSKLTLPKKMLPKVCTEPPWHMRDRPYLLPLYQNAFRSAFIPVPLRSFFACHSESKASFPLWFDSSHPAVAVGTAAGVGSISAAVVAEVSILSLCAPRPLKEVSLTCTGSFSKCSSCLTWPRRNFECCKSQASTRVSPAYGPLVSGWAPTRGWWANSLTALDGLMSDTLFRVSLGGCWAGDVFCDEEIWV